MRRLQPHALQPRKAVQQGGGQCRRPQRIVSQGLQAGAAAPLESRLPQQLRHRCRLCGCCCFRSCGRGTRAGYAARAGWFWKRQLRQRQLSAGQLEQQGVLQLVVRFQAQVKCDLRLGVQEGEVV